MMIDGLVIPEAALAAGRNVMSGVFNREDVSEAVGTVLYNLHYNTLQKQFDYGHRDKHTVNMAVTSRLLDKSKREGRIYSLGTGKWRAVKEPQEIHECLSGIHTWIHEKDKISPHDPCVKCGELYGNQD